MSLVFTQGSVSTGESAGTEAEILYFLEAFHTREALLAMPEDLEAEEFREYVKAITKHIKLCSQTDTDGDSRVPYILYALNRIKFSECWTKSQLLLPLVMDDTLKSYALSKQLLIGDLILPGHIEKCDMYWLKTLHQFNNARLSSGRPVLHISEQNYGHPRFEAFLQTTAYQEFRTRTEHLSAASLTSQSQTITSNAIKEADVEMGAESGAASAAEEYGADAESDVAMDEDRKDNGRKRSRSPDPLMDQAPSARKPKNPKVSQRTPPPRMKAKSIREVYANRSPTASTSRIAPPAKKQKLAQHVPEQPPKPKPRARGTAGLAKRKGLQTSDEADSEQSGAILKRKGKGKAATVEEVEDESDIPPRTDPKGKGRAATVEDVEDEYDSSTASSVQSEGESWDENGNVPPAGFVRQLWTFKRILGRVLTVPRQWHEKDDGSIGERALPDHNWCAWIAGVHLVISLLQMREPQGPRGILPDYDNVVLPPFPPGLMWPVNTKSAQAVKAEWSKTKDSIGLKNSYMGVPYQKVSSETEPTIRPRWPRIPKNAAELAEEILNEMDAGESERPWAEGYAAGIVKTQYRRVIKPNGEEGYQTDGDVLRNAGRKSGKAATTKRRKRAASVASTSRSRDQGSDSQDVKPRPKTRAESTEVPGPKKTRSRSKAASAASNEAPRRQFIGKAQPGWPKQLPASTGDLSTISDADEVPLTTIRQESSDRVQLELASAPGIRELAESVQSLQQEQKELRQYVTSVDQQLTAGFADVRNSIAELAASSGQLNRFFVPASGSGQSPFAAMFTQVIGDAMASMIASGVLNQQTQVRIQQDMDARVNTVRDWSRATIPPIQFPSVAPGPDGGSVVMQDLEEYSSPTPHISPSLPSPATHPMFPVKSEGCSHSVVLEAAEQGSADTPGHQAAPEIPPSHISAVYLEPNTSHFISQPINRVPQAAQPGTTNEAPPNAPLHVSEDSAIADQLAETSLDDHQEPREDSVDLQTSKSMKGDVQATDDASAVEPTPNHQPNNNLLLDRPSVIEHCEQMEPAAESGTHGAEIGIGSVATDDAQSVDPSAQTVSPTSPVGSSKGLQLSEENPQMPLASVGNSEEVVQEPIHPHNLDEVVTQQCSDEASGVPGTNNPVPDPISALPEDQSPSVISPPVNEDFEMAPATPPAAASVTTAPTTHTLVDTYGDSDSDVSFA